MTEDDSVAAHSYDPRTHKAKSNRIKASRGYGGYPMSTPSSHNKTTIKPTWWGKWDKLYGTATAYYIRLPWTQALRYQAISGITTVTNGWITDTMGIHGAGERFTSLSGQSRAAQSWKWKTWPPLECSIQYFQTTGKGHSVDKGELLCTLVHLFPLPYPFVS